MCGERYITTRDGEMEELKQEEKEPVFVQNPKQVVRTYSSITLIANILIAASGTGLSLAGFVKDLRYVLGLVFIMSVIGLIGRFVKEDVELMERGAPTGFEAVSIRFYQWVTAKLGSLKDRVKSYF